MNDCTLTALEPGNLHRRHLTSSQLAGVALKITTTTGEIFERDLAQHEATIERGLKTFVEVGQALQAIRDGRLYREQYETFEAYCLERWSMSRPRAYQLIEAAEVSGRLSTFVDTAPATESVARPLTKLPADEQADAWEGGAGDE